jgi:large subunit ribosomal protein L18e
MISKTKLKTKLRRKSNPNMIALVTFLRKQSPFWLKVAEYLVKPKRNAIRANIKKINEVTKSNSVVIVPGKVLSDGELTKSIVISAFSFSEQAKKKLSKAKIVKIADLAKENKKGDGIIIIK